MFTTPKISDYDFMFSWAWTIFFVALLAMLIVFVPIVISTIINDLIPGIVGVVIIILILGLLVSVGFGAVNDPKFQAANKDMAHMIEQKGIKIVPPSSVENKITIEPAVYSFYGRVGSELLDCRVDNQGKIFNVECISPDKTTYIPLSKAVETAKKK